MIIRKEFTPHCMPEITMSYALLLPDDYKEGEQLPMIVFLHGAGERGREIDRVFCTGLPALFYKDQSYGSTRAILLCPQCPGGWIWNHLVFGVKELIDRIAADYSADPAHIALTGLSMGGYGTWEMACTYPSFFSAIAPICGGGVTWRACLIAHLPIRVFHSEHETLVVSENSKLMVAAVNACGGNAELVLYDSYDHNCWDRAYRDTDLIPWLLTATAKQK